MLDLEMLWAWVDDTTEGAFVKTIGGMTYGRKIAYESKLGLISLMVPIEFVHIWPGFPTQV